MRNGVKRRISLVWVLGLALALDCILVLSTYASPRNVDAQVTVVPVSEGVRLQYRLREPASEFRFDPDEAASSAASMRLETPNLTLRDGVVSGRSPFKEFSLLIEPDTQRVDATYPVLARVGAKGLLLFTPPLTQDPRRGGTRFEFDLPPTAVAVDGARAKGFVFLGPSDYVVDYGPLTLVAPPDAPTTLRASVRDQATALLSFYARELGRPAPRPPVLVLAYDDQGTNTGFVGDVTPNGVVLLQVTRASHSDAAARSRVTRFLAHELFHLWNGGAYRDLPGLNGRWLSEGSAEYASWLAAEALWPEGQSLEDRVTQQLPPCMITLADEALVELKDQRAQTTRYSCGAVAHWLADVAIRGAGRGDVLDVWRRLLALRDYDVEDFETAMKSYGARAEPWLSILRGSDPDRWPKVFAALRVSGVEVNLVPPGADTLRSATVHTILRQSCTGEGIGFETIGLSEPPTAVVLRTEPMHPEQKIACGALAGDPHLIAVNGRSALGDWAPIFEDVAAACAAGTEIALRLRRGTAEQTVRMACHRPAVPLRTEYRVDTALPPADPKRRR